MKRRMFGRLGWLIGAGAATCAILTAVALAASGASPPSATSTATAQLRLETGTQTLTLPVDSFSWAVAAETSWTKGGGASVGKPNPDEIILTHTVDAASISLLKFITTGKAFPTGVLTVISGNGANSTKFVYEMEGLFVTSLRQHSEGAAPADEVSFVFKAVKLTFTDAAGNSTTGSWDIPSGVVS